MQKRKLTKKLFGTLAFFALAILSFLAVTSQSESFSLHGLWKSVQQMQPLTLVLAFLSTLFFVLFEGFAIRLIVRSYGYPCRIRKGSMYAATDVYFSAITPSAIGGQPACAYFMMKDGIPGSICAVALLCCLMMYSFSIVVIGIIALLLCPEVWFTFRLPSQILIVVGAVVQVLLAVGFYLLLRHDSWLHKLGTACLKLLKKCHLIRHYEKKQEKLDASILKYRGECQILIDRPVLLIKMFLLNFGQRLALMLVTVFCFLGFTQRTQDVIQVMGVQCMVTIGSNCVPIPGAMGVYDLLLLDGFSGVVPEELAVNLEVVSRSISFYSCLIICGLIVLYAYIRLFYLEHKREQSGITN